MLSTSQPGAGAENIKNTIGKAKMRSAFQPASKRTEPASIGSSEATSVKSICWFRESTNPTKPIKIRIQPVTTEGAIVTPRSWPRDCQTSHKEAAMISGPWPSYSVCHGPCAREIKVGTYAIKIAAPSNVGQSQSRLLTGLGVVNTSETAMAKI